MKARIFTPENRLASTLATRPDSPTIGALTQAAEARAANLKDSIRTFVGDKVRAILRFAEASDDELFADCRQLGEDAQHVAEVAAAAGLDEVGEICLGVSAMVDALTRSGIWHSDALRVHLHALLLTQQSKSATNPAAVLGRLKTMRASLGVSD